jgi:hypothetical protein
VRFNLSDMRTGDWCVEQEVGLRLHSINFDPDNFRRNYLLDLGTPRRKSEPSSTGHATARTDLDASAHRVASSGRMDQSIFSLAWAGRKRSTLLIDRMVHTL